MIGTLDVEVNAAHPNLPLCEFAAFVGSPSHVRVRNVPRGVGNWQITAVYLSVNYPDNSLPSVALTHVGALWTGTISGSAAAGRSVNGYQITADGLDESGNAITGYVLGVGDVIILNRDATITVDGVTYYLHWLDAVPTTPHIGDVATIDGTLKLYNGNAWVSFGGSAIDIVAPSTDPAAAGKAADAKATGDALAAKLSRAEAEAGFTEWKWTSMGPPITSVVWKVSASQWVGVYDGGEYPFDPPNNSNFNATALHSNDVQATRTRLPTMADLNGKASTNDVQLTPVYSQTPTFSEWTFSGTDTTMGDSYQLRYNDGIWTLREVQAGDDFEDGWYKGEAPGTADATSLHFVDDTYGPSDVTATRTRTDVIGYTLGSQSDKPLQPQGDYAPATALRYDLPTDATAISSASSEEVEGETVTYGEATLADRTANRVAITAAIAELRLTFPAAVTGKVRDFGLRVEVGDGTAALAAPALVPPAGATLENADGAIPALAEGVADAKGVTLLYFSETAPGVFLVKGEQVKEVE